MKVMGFVRDMGAGNVVSPILLELRRQGIDTKLLIENGGKAEGRVKHPATIAGSSADITQCLDAERPTIVVVGLSSPNRSLEGVFESEARLRGIPVVHTEDYVKAYDRSSLQADLILSIDEAAADLARNACPGSKVVVAGFAGIMPLTPRDEAVQAFERVRSETGAKILYCNDADPLDSASTVGLLVKSILVTYMPLRLIFQPHPKFAPVVVGPGGLTQNDVLQKLVAPLRDLHLLMPCPPGADGDEGAMLADAVCSGYSTLLGRAAASGKTALTLRTPEAAATFKAATAGRTPGLDKTWLMLMGDFPVIEESTPLDEILEAPRPPFNVKPLDVSIAARAIIDLVR